MKVPRPQPRWKSRSAMIRRLMAQKRRSETARLMTKRVVGWRRSLEWVVRLATVTRFPARLCTAMARQEHRRQPHICNTGKTLAQLVFSHWVWVGVSSSDVSSSEED